MCGKRSSLSGEADQSEVARGNRALGAEAGRAAREGVWLAYRLAAHPAAPVRERALFIIHAADPDRDRVAQRISSAASDPDARVRAFATELAERVAPPL